MAIKEFWVIIEKTEGSEGTSFNFYLHTQNIEVLTQEKLHTDNRPFQVSKSMESAAPALYVCIKSKNCLKVQRQEGEASECGFEAQALAHTNPKVFQQMKSDTETRETQSSPVVIALGLTSAQYYHYLQNGCVYRLSCLENSTEVLPSLHNLSKEPYIAVSEGVLVEMIALPCVASPGRCLTHHTNTLLEIGELVSMSYLPKLPTAFATKNSPCSRLYNMSITFTVDTKV